MILKVVVTIRRISKRKAAEVSELEEERRDAASVPRICCMSFNAAALFLSLTEDKSSEGVRYAAPLHKVSNV